MKPTLENSKPKKGIRFGIWMGLALFCAYFYGYFYLGAYFIWHVELPSQIWGWFQLLFGSIGYLVLGVVLFVPTFFLSLFLVLSDPYIWKMFWPVVITFLAGIFSPILGPIDESILFVVMTTIRYFLDRKNPPSPPSHLS